MIRRRLKEQGRARRRRELIVADPGREAYLLWISVSMLVAIGVVMVFNTSFFHAQERFGDAYLFARRQVVAVFLGAVALLVASRLPLEAIRRMTYPFLLLVLALLVLVLVPGLGVVGGGARRWLPLFGIHFQPSELAKLAIVLYLAHSLAKKGPRIEELGKGFLPHLAIVGVAATLVALEPDFGTAVLVGLVAVAMLFAAGARWTHLGATTALALPPVAWLALSADYRWQRMTSFLDPWRDAQKSGFQLVQSFLAFGSGGILGVGLGAGQQKMFYLPGAHTDFIFSVIGEELGLVGTLGVLALFGLFAYAGLRLAWTHPDPFAAHLALGLTLLVVLQASINMGVAVGLLPTKGIALPFVSYGGSALTTNLVMVGMLLAVSRESR